MAATGKKSKKVKWNRANITDIIAEPTAIATTNSWAEAGDDEQETFGFNSRPHAPVVLPSASRAARGGLAVDDESIPKKPPFIAHISNLPYDVDESAISELFDGLKAHNIPREGWCQTTCQNLQIEEEIYSGPQLDWQQGREKDLFDNNIIISLRLPRESDRLKGYGYIDFEDRESLINAMNMPDLTISGRRIRICVSTQETDRRMGRGGRSDREREYDPERTMGDWRSGPRVQPVQENQARSRNMDRENMREPRERERESSADNRPGGWRDGDRAAAEPARTPYGGRDSFGRDRYGEDRGRERGGFGSRDGFRATERDGYGSRENRGFGGRNFGERDPTKEESVPRERPKLNLLPRTVPRETEVPTKPADGAPLDTRTDADAAPAPKSVPAEKVFGAAKPVDTAAKEREIEERLLKQEEESRRAVEEKERWGRRSDHSGDRRGGARRDDRDRDSRSYNRDRRDYSKDDRDNRDDRRRDYSKDDRDRRDYPKDDRDRRDYSKEDRDRRDYPKEDRDRRDYSKEDKDRRDYSKDDRDNRDYNHRDRRDYEIKDDKDRREYSNRDRRDYDDRDRDNSGAPRQSRERNGSSDRDVRDDRTTEDRNGRPRPRSADRPDEIDEKEKALPKLKEQEKPNFVASNKFSFLEDADDGGSSD